MRDSNLPDEVRALILAYVVTIAQIDMLLLLRADPDRAWTAPALARELRIGEAYAAAELERFEARGFLLREGDSYRYAPKSGEIAAAVSALASAYVTHPVAIVSLVYSRPAQDLRTFVDAFRLRKG
jgi:hypothetical protein